MLRLSTLADHLDGLHHHLGVASWLLGFCGLASLVLAAMGIQSLLAFRVARQRREIGLRMALGAAHHAVIRFIVGRTLGGVLLGLAAGNVGAYILSQAFRTIFVGVAALQTGTLVLSTLLLLSVAMLSSAGPVLKAVRIGPAAALRNE